MRHHQHRRFDALGRQLDDTFAAPGRVAHNRHGVDHGVGDDVPRRLPVSLGHPQLFDPRGLLLEAVPRHQLAVVAAHPADVVGDVSPDERPGMRRIVGDAGDHPRRNRHIAGAAPGPASAQLEVGPKSVQVAGGEKDRRPSIGQLPGELHVLGPHGGQVDGNTVPWRREAQTEVSQLEKPAVVDDPLAADDQVHDLDVLPRALDGLLVRHAMPVLDDLGAAGSQTQDRPAFGDVVQRGDALGHQRRRPAVDIDDAGGQLDARGVAGDVGEDGEQVAAPGLADPQGVVAQLLGPLRELDHPASPDVVAQAERQANGRLHRRVPASRFRVVAALVPAFRPGRRCARCPWTRRRSASCHP